MWLFFAFVTSTFAIPSGFLAKDVVDHKDVNYKLTDPSVSKGTVVAFLSSKCPCSAGHESDLKKLHQEFSNKGFGFIGIHSNQDETPELSQEHFASAKLPFPVIEDSKAKIADEFKAFKTPHVYIIQNGKIVYQGGVDDTSDGEGAEKFYLRDALNQLAKNQIIQEPKTRVLGCIIKR